MARRPIGARVCLAIAALDDARVTGTDGMTMMLDHVVACRLVRCSYRGCLQLGGWLNGCQDAWGCTTYYIHIRP